MSLFYEQKETEKETIIIFKYQAAWYIILLAFVLSPFTGITKEVQSFIFIPFIIISLTWIIGNWKINIKIRKAIRDKQVEVSGSKFSFKNPLTFKIKK